MKKYQTLVLFASMAMMFLSGCTSVNVNRKIDQERDVQDQKEPWRYQIPQNENAPVRPVFPKVLKSELKNGLTILVVEDHRLPIAEVSMALKNGSARDPFGLAGLINFTTLMLKEGTRSMTSLELAEAFANLGTEVSVGAAKDMSQIEAAVLSNKVDDVIALIASMVKEPRMAEDDFARVKMQHENALASQQGVLSYVAQTSFLLTAYGEKHPYAHPSIGTLESVAKITLPEVKKAHHDNFGANNAVLIAVGDVTMPQIEAAAKKYLGHWKRIHSVLTKVANPIAHKQMQTRLVSRSNSPQTYVLIGQPVASQKDKDLPTLEVFQHLLAGLPTSRLDANLRENKGWTYGVSSQITPLLGKGPMMVSTSVQVPYGSDAIKEILQEFEQLKETPVSDAELDKAKNNLLHSFAGRYSTVGKVADAVANQFIYTLPANHDEVVYDKIAKVSKEDILLVAKKVLKKEHMTAVAVGELEAMEMPIAKMNVGKVIIEHESPPKAK